MRLSVFSHPERGRIAGVLIHQPQLIPACNRVVGQGKTAGRPVGRDFNLLGGYLGAGRISQYQPHGFAFNAVIFSGAGKFTAADGDLYGIPRAVKRPVGGNIQFTVINFSRVIKAFRNHGAALAVDAIDKALIGCGFIKDGNPFFIGVPRF